MVTIANPIYDVVFKYLFEDLRIAKVIIASLIAEEGRVLAVRPLRNEVVEQAEEGRPRLLRLDFSAKVELAGGKVVEVCIEIQKVLKTSEICRFRSYLASQYCSDANKDKEGRPLHIISIYILGHNIPGLELPITYVKNVIKDKDGVVFEPASPIEFIEALTSEMVIVQARRIPKQRSSRLEKILNFFRVGDDGRFDRHVSVDYDEDEKDVEIVNIVRRLEAALINESVRRQIDIEKEFYIDEQDMKEGWAKFHKAERELEQEQKRREEAEKLRVEAERNASMLKERLRQAYRKMGMVDDDIDNLLKG